MQLNYFIIYHYGIIITHHKPQSIFENAAFFMQEHYHALFMSILVARRELLHITEHFTVSVFMRRVRKAIRATSYQIGVTHKLLCVLCHSHLCELV